MKRIICAALAVFMLAALFAGCGEKNRVLYKSGLSKYIDLGDYKGIEVDTSSDEFGEYYDTQILSDVENYDLYVRKTEGKVEDGDTVNIDYVGKKDGVAFDGGTADAQYLTIGSDSFIDGFEDGLIGAEIGSTVDLNLKFPDDYQSEELAGQAVVFTVTVNYVKTDEERKPEDYYSELEFDTLEDYTADVKERAAKAYLVDKVKENSKVKEYPEKDTETIYTAYRNMLEQNIQGQYGMDLAAYLGYMSQTEEQFKESAVEDQIKPLMDEQMVLYALLDNEKIEITDEEVQKELDEAVKSYNSSNVTAETLNDFYGDYYFEYIAVREKAVDFLYDNAKIS